MARYWGPRRFHYRDARGCLRHGFGSELSALVLGPRPLQEGSYQVGPYRSLIYHLQKPKPLSIDSPLLNSPPEASLNFGECSLGAALDCLGSSARQLVDWEAVTAGWGMRATPRYLDQGPFIIQICALMEDDVR